MATKAKPLGKYKAKRDFKITPEPAAKVAKEGNLYVVQRHQARRLHYDLRLQHAGVLLSWAVPKEPTMEPGIKRLAVHVEDHPVDYGSFEGTIPEGEYGAGIVEIWDRGTWEPHGDVDEALKEGNLKFRIDGDRLKGEFDLVRMGEESEKENWLLIKRKEAAVSDESAEVDFMLCRPSKTPATGKDWTHEIKWDGYRVFVKRDEKDVKILTRGHRELDLPAISDALKKLLPINAMIDGELVVLDDDGRSDFRKLQAALPEAAPSITFVAFDVIHDGSKDMRSSPIEDRRIRLRELLEKAKDPIRISVEIPGSGSDALAACCELGYEGIVSKRRGSLYQAGRGSDWQKTKCDQNESFVVVGFTLLAGSRSSVGSLVVAEDHGDGLRHVGRVGTGFKEKDRAELFAKLSPLSQKSAAVEGVDTAQRKGVTWVEPKVRVKVAYLDQGESGVMRQARYQGLEERAEPTIVPKFVVTSGDRVIDKTTGATKQDVANYYAQHLDLIFPYLAGRAVSLIRCPEGVDGECFFQRNPPSHKLSGMGSLEHEGHTYLVVEKPEAILSAAQYGTIEFHPWGSLAAKPMVPDRLVFDLDPSPEVSWEDIKEGAQLVREQLTSLGLKVLPRLTGGKGVHLFVPIKPELEWPEIKAFAKSLAQACVQAHPTKFVAEMSKEKRKGRIFIDYLRNEDAATAVASFSLRSRPGLGLAANLTGPELAEATAANIWNLARAQHEPLRDPWGDLKKQTVSLKKVLGL